MIDTSRLIVVIIVWITCGLLAYLIDFYKPKFPDEEMPTIKHYLFWGCIMLLCVLFTYNAPTIDDDEL